MKPNLVLINCDDLGYGDLGCYGSVKNDTPYLDRLAEGGVRYTDFYMASPVCSPSRGAMMTGCYPPRIGFGDFHGEVVLFPGDDIGLNPEEISLATILKNAGQPFFLYLAHMHVHLPLYAPEHFVKKSRNGDYGACVMAIDWSTGAIVEALKKHGVYENTIIIFTSDNGSRNDFGESNGRLRGGKRETWEGGQRVPFIVHWNGTIAPGVSDQLLTSLDLYPSLAAITGATVPSDRIIDGIDLSDLILGKTRQSKREEFFYYLCNTLEAARVGDWKLHVAKPRTSRETSVTPKPSIDDDVAVKELYNLREDPSESHNVYDAHPDIVADIRRRMERCREDIGDAFTNTPGQNIRPIGHVKNPKPLTVYDENHPYIVSLYDKTEVG